MSTQPVRVDETKQKETFSVHSGGGALCVTRKSRKWIYIGVVVLLAVVALIAAYPKIMEAIAFVRAMEGYAYGFPLIITDITRQVETAVPTAGELAAPINQFSRVRGYIPWNFVNVVRVSFNSLWSWACLDLQKEPRRCESHRD